MPQAISALQFPGEVTVLTSDTLTSATNLQNVPSDRINAFNLSTDRQAANISVQVEYYIQTEYNLDSLVQVRPDATDETDDTWSFASDVNGVDGVTASSTSSFGNIVYKLPTCSNVPVLIQTVSLWAETGNVTYSIDGQTPVTLESGGPILSEAFNLFAYISINSSAVSTATVAFEGANGLQNITLSAPEDINLAQAVSFGYMNPIEHISPQSVDADILSATLTADMLNTSVGTLSTQLDGIKGVYDNKQLLSSWSYTFEAQPFSQTNAISKHARFANWQPNAEHYFQATDLIVTSAGKDFVIDVLDKNQGLVQLVSGVVYGVLKNNREK